jgi:hypothetical protein
MNPAFREMFEGLKEMGQHLMAATTALQQANAALQKTAEAALRANDEHEDVRATVHRLESLVMELSRDVRDLRARLS